MRAAKAASNEGSGRSKKKLHRMKLIVVGDSCSGKTELVSRWVEERHSGGRYSQTIGVDHHVKRHIIPKQSGNQADSFDLRVNLWELAGADLFLDVRNEFYKDAKGIVLLFDILNLRSFQSLPKWLEEIKEHGGGGALPTVLVGAKSDSQANTQISELDAREFASTYGFLYAECSSLTGQGVGSVFDSIIAQVLQNLPNIPPELVSQAARKAIPTSKGPVPPLTRIPSSSGMRESFRRGSLDIERDRDSSGSLIQVADAVELRRISSASNDWEVLKLERSATMAQVKSSYRKLAVAVHPDKCKLGEAQAAFQKINSAYQNLVNKLG